MTNYTTSTIPQAAAPLTYVNDNDYEGLEEQLLTEDDATDEELQEGEIADVTANRVVTPQGMQTSDGPLNPMYTQQTTGGEMDLDMQPSRGPKNFNTSMGEALNAYMDDDYNDILRTSQMKTSFSLLSLNNTTASRPQMPLDNRWHLSGLNYIDSFDESRSRCDCPFGRSIANEDKFQFD